MKKISLEELFEAGSHLGHSAKKWHPKMAPWIYTEQAGVHIFDLEKTAAQIEKAYEMAFELGKNKKNLVVVCTKKQSADRVEELAKENGAMFITHRWMGGLVTNWEQVGKSVKRMNELKTGLEGERYTELTKYERTVLAKELDRLERFFIGIKDLKGTPDAAFIVDVKHEKNAVKELSGEKVPMMAIVDSNSDPTPIEVVMAANDDALSSVELIAGAVLAGYKAGKEGKVVKEEAKKEEVKKEEAKKEEIKKEKKKD
ncbi:30S ribosomal protein S2 [Microgenomates group bacterium]|nr:30S ribosomal protein S2 [Microgenomates group bacterium]